MSTRSACIARRASRPLVRDEHVAGGERGPDSARWTASPKCSPESAKRACVVEVVLQDRADDVGAGHPVVQRARPCRGSRRVSARSPRGCWPRRSPRSPCPRRSRGRAARSRGGASPPPRGRRRAGAGRGRWFDGAAWWNRTEVPGRREWRTRRTQQRRRRPRNRSLRTPARRSPEPAGEPTAATPEPAPTWSPPTRRGLAVRPGGPCWPSSGSSSSSCGAAVGGVLYGRASAPGPDIVVTRNRSSRSPQRSSRCRSAPCPCRIGERCRARRIRRTIPSSRRPSSAPRRACQTRHRRERLPSRQRRHQRRAGGGRAALRPWGRSRPAGERRTAPGSSARRWAGPHGHRRPAVHLDLRRRRDDRLARDRGAARAGHGDRAGICAAGQHRRRRVLRRLAGRPLLRPDRGDGVAARQRAAHGAWLAGGVRSQRRRRSGVGLLGRTRGGPRLPRPRRAASRDRALDKPAVVARRRHAGTRARSG